MNSNQVGKWQIGQQAECASLCAQSAGSFQMIPNQERMPTHQRVVLSFKRTSTGWRNKSTGFLQSSAKRKAKSCTGSLPGKQLGRAGPGCPGGQIEHASPVCPHMKQHPGLCQEDNCQQVSEGAKTVYRFSPRQVTSNKCVEGKQESY